MLCCIFAATLSMRAQTEEKPLLTIGCLSDVHCMNSMITPASGLLSDIRVRSSMTQVLDRMKQEDNVDVIVLGGDCQSDKTIDEANAMMTRWRIAEATRGFFPEGKAQNVIWVTGNHDWEVANFDNIPKPYLAGDFYRFPMKEDIGILPEGEGFYEMANNGTLGQVSLLAAYHYVLNGFDFVVLNCGKNFFKSAWDYTYSKESAEWVKAKMDEIYADDPNKTVFFCLHIPFQDSNSINSGKGMVESSDAVGILKSCFSEHPNLIMLYGHDHGKDNAYIRTHTSQRVTLYDTAGKVISTTDATHIDGDVNTTGGGSSTTSKSFSLYNANTAKYLNIDSYNLSVGTEELSFTASSTADVFRFVSSTGHGLHIGSSGRWSRSNDGSEASDVFVYSTEGKRVTAMEGGEEYYLVGLSGGEYYALKAEIYNPGGSGQRLVGTKVSLSSDKSSITTVPGATCLWTTKSQKNEPAPEETDDLKGVYIKSNSGEYFGLASDVAVLSEGYPFWIKQHSAFTNGYTLGNVADNLWINSGSYGYLSQAAESNNGRPFFFYEATVTESGVSGTLVNKPELGKEYIIVVQNVTPNYPGFYAMYCSLASGKNNRFDVIKITADKNTVPPTVNFTTSTTSSNGKIDFSKAVWTLEKAQTTTDPDPKPTGEASFFSSFMGSLRYYYNTFDAGDPADMPTVVQALLVYVYKDRVVLQMKNYNQTGVIKGIEIAETPASYTSLREVTHSTPVTYVKGEKTLKPEEPEAEQAPEWPLENHPYAIKHVETGYYLNVRNHASECTILGSNPEAFYFTWRGVGNKGFTIKNADGLYIGGHSNTWNMSSSTPEYWTVDAEEGGYYSFGCATAGKGKHIGFDSTALGSTAYRDKYVATEHGKFEIIDLEPTEGIRMVDSHIIYAPSEMYDLQGRRVSMRGSKRGVLICNNGKFIR